jgi:uncharacterized damage-inducible protein DinB
MTSQEVHLLFLYNQWANRRTLDACASLAPEQFTRELDSSFPSLRDTLAHIVGAQWIWYERFFGRSHPGLPTGSEFPDLVSLRARFDEVDRGLVNYVSTLTPAELERVVEYKNTAGVAFTNPLWQLLQHLANHGTYHRGQAATMLRQLGAKPAATDLIAFYRERAAAA